MLSIMVLLKNEYHYEVCHFTEHLGIAVVVVVVVVVVVADGVTYVSTTDGKELSKKSIFFKKTFLWLLLK
jgi:hypothetical protein